MAVDKFEKMLFHEDMVISAGTKIKSATIVQDFHSTEMNMLAQEIEKRWIEYFAPRKDGTVKIDGYLKSYSDAKDPQTREILSTVSVYLHQKEKLARYMHKGCISDIKKYDEQIAQVQAAYREHPADKKLKKALVKLISEKAEILKQKKRIEYDLRLIVEKYRPSLRKAIDCSNYIK